MSDDAIMEELRAIRRMLAEQSLVQLDIRNDILKIRHAQIEAKDRMRLQERIERIERHLDECEGDQRLE